MKKFLTVFALVALAFSNSPARASDPIGAISEAQLSAFRMAARNFDLINWKVGDTANFSVTLASLPINGSMVESVTKDDGDGTLWFRQDMDLIIQKQTVDIQLDKSSGKILKMEVNGQEQTPPADDIQIQKQEYTSITVKAGTFKCIHIVATEGGNPVELWANPTATVMEGTLKMTTTQQSMTITMELQNFKHGPQS